MIGFFRLIYKLLHPAHIPILHPPPLYTCHLSQVSTRGAVCVPGPPPRDTTHTHAPNSRVLPPCMHIY